MASDRQLMLSQRGAQHQPELVDYRLRLWAHTCGFRGHFLTKSRRYSSTFGALRAERQQWRLAALGKGEADEESSPVGDETREWRYEGSGYLTAGDVCLARNLEDELRLGRLAAREDHLEPNMGNEVRT